MKMKLQTPPAPSIGARIAAASADAYWGTDPNGGCAVSNGAQSCNRKPGHGMKHRATIHSASGELQLAQWTDGQSAIELQKI